MTIGTQPGTAAGSALHHRRGAAWMGVLQARERERERERVDAGAASWVEMDNGQTLRCVE